MHSELLAFFFSILIWEKLQMKWNVGPRLLSKCCKKWKWQINIYYYIFGSLDHSQLNSTNIYWPKAFWCHCSKSWMMKSISMFFSWLIIVLVSKRSSLRCSKGWWYWLKQYCSWWSKSLLNVQYFKANRSFWARALLHRRVPSEATYKNV